MPKKPKEEKIYIPKNTAELLPFICTHKRLFYMSDAEDKIMITITDNGTGADLTDKQKEHNSIGIKNAKKRLSVQCGGLLEVSYTENGSRSVITLPKSSKETEAVV